MQTRQLDLDLSVTSLQEGGKGKQPSKIGQSLHTITLTDSLSVAQSFELKKRNFSPDALHRDRSTSATRSEEQRKKGHMKGLLLDRHPV